MVKGLPKAIIKKYGVTKKAWQVYRGRKKSRSRGSNPKTRTKTKKRRRFSLARRRGRRRRSNSMTIPIAPIAGFIGAKASRNIINDVLTGNMNAIPSHMGGYIGLWSDGSFHIEELLANVTPMVVGALVHKFVGGRPLNLNASLARAGIPFIRI